MFGHKVTLKYKSKDEFRSAFGGVFGLFCKIGIAIYSLLVLVQTFQRQKYTIIQSSEKLDIDSDDSIKAILTKDNFDIAYTTFIAKANISEITKKPFGPIEQYVNSSFVQGYVKFLTDPVEI